MDPDVIDHRGGQDGDYRGIDAWRQKVGAHGEQRIPRRLGDHLAERRVRRSIRKPVLQPRDAHGHGPALRGSQYGYGEGAQWQDSRALGAPRPGCHGASTRRRSRCMRRVKDCASDKGSSRICQRLALVAQSARGARFPGQGQLEQRWGIQLGIVHILPLPEVYIISLIRSIKSHWWGRAGGRSQPRSKPNAGLEWSH